MWQCCEQILLQDLIVIQNAKQHQEKTLRPGPECKAVQDAAPELPEAEQSHRGKAREAHAGKGRVSDGAVCTHS